MKKLTPEQEYEVQDLIGRLVAKNNGLSQSSVTNEVFEYGIIDLINNDFLDYLSE